MLQWFLGLAKNPVTGVREGICGVVTIVPGIDNLPVSVGPAAEASVIIASAIASNRLVVQPAAKTTIRTKGAIDIVKVRTACTS